MAQCASLQALARPATHGSRMSYRAEVMLGLSGLRETWRDLRRGRPVQFREERPTKGFLSADIYTAERTIAIFDSAEEVWPRRATPGRAPMSRSLLVWPAGYKLDRLVRCAAWRQGPPLRSAWVAMGRHDGGCGLGRAGRSFCMAEYADGAGAPNRGVVWHAPIGWCLPVADGCHPTLGAECSTIPRAAGLAGRR